MAVSTATPKRRSRISSSLYSYLFVLPYVVLLILFGVFPALYTIGLSFSDPFSDVFSFSGLNNYIVAFRDFRFAPAILNIFQYLIIWLPVTVFGVLLLALLLHARAGKFSTTMRLIYYLPGAITGSASVLLWLFMLDPQISPFGSLLHLFGLSVFRDSIDGPRILIALTIIAFSVGAGGWIVIMYGAFQNISQEIVEAAIIDGCSAIQTALYIKLPLIGKYIVYMLILSFAGGTQLFVEPQLLGQQGGAGQWLISPTWSPNLLAYDFGFNIGNMGASAAISMVLLLVGVLAALILIFKTNFFETR